MWDTILTIIVIAASAAMLCYLGAEKRKLDRLAAENRAAGEKIIGEANERAEALKRAAIIEAKDEAYRLKAEVEQEIRERRTELQRLERRLGQKEETLDRRGEAAEKKEHALQQQEIELQRSRTRAAELIKHREAELQRVAQMTLDEARAVLMQQIEETARHDAARLARSIEAEARREAHNNARRVIALAIQKCAVDQTSETTVSVVPIPGDDMKGRIIGREGRNIRTFETLTGVDVIIDDTPEAVVISAFDPVRREIARIALTELILDGRIHPARIEEAVASARQQVEKIIVEAGDSAVLETGIRGLAPGVVRLLGQMKYRTSYGQNVLRHSIEVSHIAAALAGEIGADVTIARRAGLLHDIGKAVDHSVEGTHAAIGADLLRQYNEQPEVIHAVEAHHDDTGHESVEAVLVMCADAISASRPGARRETLEIYVKRVRQLEDIAQAFPGVDRSFAVQAGREVRLIVKPDEVDDVATTALARGLAKRIEEEMEYPGQIKVTVIRETRTVEYAK